MSSHQELIPAPIPPSTPATLNQTASYLPRTPDRFDPVALLKALRRRWLLALALGLLAALLAAPLAYVIVPPALYTARATLLVQSNPPRIILNSRESVSDYGAYQRTQLAFLRSRLVLGTALQNEEVAKLPEVVSKVDPIEWLEKQIQVELVNGSEILRISMSGDKPEAPMLIVNAVVTAYLANVVDDETRKRRDRFELLKETWNRYQENLRGKREQLRQLTRIAGADDKDVLADLQKQELNRLARVEEELAKTQGEIRTLKVEAEVLQGEIDRATERAIDPAAIEEEMRNDPSYARLLDDLDVARRGLEDASRLTRSTSDPAVAQRRRMVNLAEQAVKAQRRESYAAAKRRIEDSLSGGAANQLATIALRLKILTGIEESLTKDAGRLSKATRDLNNNAIDISAIKEEIETAETVAKTIGTEVETLNVELQASARVREIERATLPRTKDEGRAWRVASFTGMGAFALGLLGVSFWEFRSRRIDSAEDVAGGLGLRVVGVLPRRPAVGRAGALSKARSLRWENLFIESVDAARTVILHFARTESVRVVMVASAVGGEGKTSLASHLVFSLARAGRTTLLIDGDIRRPRAHQLFDLPLGPGLSEVLRGEVPLEDAIVPSPVAGAFLLPAGEGDGAAVQALASANLREMFDHLLGRFDMIVIDSSPVLPVADALLIGQHVDAVIMSVMRSVSQFPKVQAAFQRIASLGIRVIGAVVTGIEGPSYNNDYMYQYSSRKALDASRGENPGAGPAEEAS